MIGHFREAEPAPDPALDPLRRGIARLWSGDQLVGFLATRIQVWWTPVGPFWRRRDVDPAEALEWMVTYVRSDPRDHPDQYDDGVIREYDHVRAELADLNANRFQLPNAELVRVEWLDGEDAKRAWSEHGWD